MQPGPWRACGPRASGAGQSAHRHPGRSTIIECRRVGDVPRAVERRACHTQVASRQFNEGQGQDHGAFELRLVGWVNSAASDCRRWGCLHRNCANDKQAVITAQGVLPQSYPHFALQTGGVRRKASDCGRAGGYFLRFSGATPDCVRCHSAWASSAAALSGIGPLLELGMGVDAGAPCGVSTSPSRSSSRVRARWG